MLSQHASNIAGFHRQSAHCSHTPLKVNTAVSKEAVWFLSCMCGVYMPSLWPYEFVKHRKYILIGYYEFTLRIVIKINKRGEKIAAVHGNKEIFWKLVWWDESISSVLHPSKYQSFPCYFPLYPHNLFNHDPVLT